jgi:hypothetical protein
VLECLPSLIGFNFAVDAYPSSFFPSCLEWFQPQSTWLFLDILHEVPTLSGVPHGCTIDERDGGSERRVAAEAARKPVRVLLVVAHPDDEYEVAGTVCRISKELFGTVDQVVITDGEAGYRYSSLAVPYYGIDLPNEAVGRARLPGIRKEEARRAGRILGIQHQWFLNEKDDRFMLDAGESLDRSWQ